MDQLDQSFCHGSLPASVLHFAGPEFALFIHSASSADHSRVDFVQKVNVRNDCPDAAYRGVDHGFIVCLQLAHSLYFLVNGAKDILLYLHFASVFVNL